MKKKKNVTEQEINEKVFDLQKKNFTNNFKSMSREQRHQALTDRSVRPVVGQYSPKKEFTLS